MNRILLFVAALAGTFAFVDPAGACIPGGSSEPIYVFANGDTVDSQCFQVFLHPSGELAFYAAYPDGTAYTLIGWDGFGAEDTETVHVKGQEHLTHGGATSWTTLGLASPLSIGGVLLVAVGGGLAFRLRRRKRSEVIPQQETVLTQAG